MPGLLPNIDPDGLLEYSVVYTDRSLNHMSHSFQNVMNEVSSSLKPFLLPLALEYKLSILNCSKSLLAPITGLAGLAFFTVNLIRPK